MKLPSESTPLNQHSLEAIEFWLKTIGASQSSNNPCQWILSLSEASGHIEICPDELMIIWHNERKETKFSFPYGLSRQDIEDALLQGP